MQVLLSVLKKIEAIELQIGFFISQYSKVSINYSYTVRCNPGYGTAAQR